MYAAERRVSKSILSMSLNLEMVDQLLVTVD